MKQSGRVSLFILLTVCSVNFSSGQKLATNKKLKNPSAEQIDDRIDNIGYWNKLAHEGLVPVSQPIPVAPAEFTGSMIEAKSIKGVKEDSPDVAVTDQTNVTESENSIFINPEDNEFVINSNNSTSWSGGFAGTLYGANYFMSEDGGLNWGGSSSGPGGSNSGDPTTAISLDGSYIFVNYITNPGGQGIARSSNGGINWTNFNVAPNPGYLADKNHMWIDNCPGSPFAGNLYIAWTSFSFGSDDSQISLSRSVNNGENWSSPMVISAAVNAGSHNQGVNLQTGPDGEVYAIWAIYDSYPADEKALGFAKSTDGGVSFAPATRIINNIRGIRNSGAVGKDMRVNSFPSMAVDIGEGQYNGNIYAVWCNKGVPGINSGTDSDVYLIKSEDGGSNWSSPIRVNQDPPGMGKQHYFPWITCDPETGILSAIWYDDRNVNSSQCEVYCANSFDAGETWEDFKVSDVAFTPAPIPGLADGYMGDYLGIQARGSKVYPVWTDNRNGLYMTYTSPYTTNNLPKPENLVINLDEVAGTTLLGWQFNSKDFLYFNIYRNGELIDTTFSNIYSDNLPDYGVYNYSVTAIHDEGESIPTSGSIQWGNPHIALDPLVVNAVLDAGDTTTKTFNIMNTGELDLEYAITTEITSNKSPKSYCTASSNICDEFIGQVIFGDINNSSGCDKYADYTQYSTTVNPGDTYDLTVTNGNVYTDDDLGVWIDWNQDEDFDDPGENVVCDIDNSGEGTFPIAIPDDAMSGQTRMRIRIKWTGSDCGNPCGTTTYGEVEDYSVNVVGWIQTEPTLGTITAGNEANINVHLDAGSLVDGTYTANLNITSNDPDSALMTVPVTLIVGGTILEVTAAADPIEICEGDSTQLSAEPVGALGPVIYSWGPTEVLSDPNIANPLAMPDTTTTFIVTADDGFTMTTDSITILVDPLPGVPVVPTGVTEMCQGNPGSSYSTTGSPLAKSYIWFIDPPEAGTLTGDSLTANVDWNPDYSGPVTISVAGMNDCGESPMSDNLDVMIHPTPEVTLAAFNNVHENTPAFELTGGSPEGGVYSGPGVDNGWFDPSVAGIGVHTITYDFIDEFGCENYAGADIEVLEAAGIDEISDGFRLRIFPNPSKGIFTISLTSLNTDRVNLKIVNNRGNSLFEENDINVVSGLTKKFDLGGFAGGLYYIYVYSGESKILRKIVIRK